MKRSLRHLAFSPLTVFLALLTPGVGWAQLIGPDFNSDYSAVDLGTPIAVPGPLGGINFKPGDPNTLWVGGGANTGSGAIYEVPVMRDAAGHIVGYAGSGTAAITAPNIDGGMCFSSDGVLFVTTYSNNRLLQYLPGSTSPDSNTDLSALGVTSSVGTCQFVPPGFPGAGKLKVGSYSASQWYDLDIVINPQGTYDVLSATATVNTGGGPEGIVYVAGGNPAIANDTALVSEYNDGAVRAYELDGNGDAIESTQRDFMTGLNGAEGAVIDPVTGDFLFCTFGGGNRVLVVSGFDQPTVFCGGKVNSQGCIPTITVQGSPTLTGANDFVLVGSGMLNNSFGIMLWSNTSGSTPLGGGVLCLSGPFYRHPVQFSGGTAGMSGTDCTGGYSDFLSQSWFNQNAQMVGMSIFAQYLSRDAGFAMPNNLSLSDGLRFTIL